MIINKNKVSKINQKNVFVLLGVLFLAILFLNVDSVSAENLCWTETNAPTCLGPGNSILLYLSGTSNAHASIAPTTGYDNVICCNFAIGNPATCDSTNTLLKLSSASNAHIERPEYNNYTEKVCYSYLKDAFTANNAVPGVNEVLLTSLSSFGNAHLSGYTINVIATAQPPAVCDLTSGSWSTSEVFAGSNVNMIVGGTLGCSDETISFEVKRGTETCSSIAGCTAPPNIVFGSGATTATKSWTAGPADAVNYTFIAKVVANPSESVTSGQLRVKEEPPWCTQEGAPIICSDYANQTDCGANECNVAKYDIEVVREQGVGFCDGNNINCDCEWNVGTNVCESVWSSSLGTCKYIQTTDDNCDDGFLSVSWTPEVIFEGCEAGSKTIECPAQIALPFFSFYNILAVIIVIAAVYWAIHLMKKKRKEKAKGKSGRKK